METYLFLPYTWKDLTWWINTTKCLVNDIFGRRVCGTRSLVTRVEEYSGGEAFKPFELILELLRWITCDSQYQLEVVLTIFTATRRDKTYMKWLKTKKRV
jgi:hypothetical protein